MMMLKIFTAAIFSFFISLSAFCQSDTTAIKGVGDKLKAWLMKHPVEQVYLQFDKPYYAAGDTIYFKAYVTLGEKHQLSLLSGVLHVDLINTENKIDRSIKLKVDSGTAWGDFALPDSLPKGNYRIRAYTQWMRNSGEGCFFNRVIPVGSLNKPTLIAKNKLAVNQTFVTAQVIKTIKPDLQFFPEGGEMINGINSKVAFKAIGPTGTGVNVKGVVLDNNSHIVARFKSTHLGMGFFYLKPITGQSYHAEVTYDDGSKSNMSLPIASDKGFVLTVNNDTLGKAVLRVIAGNDYFHENRNKVFSLSIYSGGTVTVIKSQLDSQVTRFDVQTRRLHSGIVQFTLFSSTDVPLSERQIFINNPDKLKIGIGSAPSSQQRRGKVQITLNVNNKFNQPTVGHFSVSVINEQIVAADENSENNILTELLLTADLKGYVEQPNYYFLNFTDTTRADLDVLMMTQGYRRFNWKQVLNNNQFYTWQPENGLEISGTIKNMFGKPLAYGSVSLINLKKKGIIMEQSDKNGIFRFTNLSFPDTARFIIQAVNSHGKNVTRINYIKNETVPIPETSGISNYIDVNASMEAYLINNSTQNEYKARYGTISGKVLKEVEIKDKKINKTPSYNSVRDPIDPEFASQVITQDQMAKGGTFADRAEGVLANIRVVRGSNGAIPYLTRPNSGPMLLIIDGQLMFSSDLNQVLPDEVESIEIDKGFANIFGMRGGNGAIQIITRKDKGIQLKDISSTGILPIQPTGYYKAREFYSPKYDHPAIANDRPDLRSTIFWRPELITTKEGNATFEYYTADATGTYIITVEGIDNDGNLGRQVYRYKVN